MTSKTDSPSIDPNHPKFGFSDALRARPRAYDFGGGLERRLFRHIPPISEQVPKRPAPRPKCGAKRHRDGQPCESKAEPGKNRCRFHGGRSTGPKSVKGKARALANLRQFLK